MKKVFAFCLLTVFIIRHNPTEDVAVQFEGLTQAQIAAMYTKDGVSFDFVSQKAFGQFVADKAAQPKPSDPSGAAKEQAILDANDTSKTTQARLDAIIKAIDLK